MLVSPRAHGEFQLQVIHFQQLQYMSNNIAIIFRLLVNYIDSEITLYTCQYLETDFVWHFPASSFQYLYMKQLKLMCMHQGRQKVKKSGVEIKERPIISE